MPNGHIGVEVADVEAILVAVGAVVSYDAGFEIVAAGWGYCNAGCGCRRVGRRGCGCQRGGDEGKEGGKGREEGMHLDLDVCVRCDQQLQRCREEIGVWVTNGSVHKVEEK